MRCRDGDQRLVAVLTHLSDQYGEVSGIGIWKQRSACWTAWILPPTPISTQPKRGIRQHLARGR